jgi:hypothetical protein
LSSLSSRERERERLRVEAYESFQSPQLHPFAPIGPATVCYSVNDWLM